jgi:hypothetical protein
MMLFGNRDMNLERVWQHLCWSNGKTQVESACVRTGYGSKSERNYTSNDNHSFQDTSNFKEIYHTNITLSLSFFVPWVY